MLPRAAQPASRPAALSGGRRPSAVGSGDLWLGLRCMQVYSELIGNIMMDAVSAKKYWHFVRQARRTCCAPAGHAARTLGSGAAHARLF